ncbi:hypothetical protein DFJ73DRAFT_763233 [Zopfochytrium polystomum]|nr:hypothetical protein DFJ73DRAFT_763233 [Zopfochytrium polystomum]
MRARVQEQTKKKKKKSDVPISKENQKKKKNKNRKIQRWEDLSAAIAAFVQQASNIQPCSGSVPSEEDLHVLKEALSDLSAFTTIAYGYKLKITELKDSSASVPTIDDDQGSSEGGGFSPEGSLRYWPSSGPSSGSGMSSPEPGGSTAYSGPSAFRQHGAHEDDSEREDFDDAEWDEADRDSDTNSDSDTDSDGDLFRQHRALEYDVENDSEWEDIDDTEWDPQASAIERPLDIASQRGDIEMLDFIRDGLSPGQLSSAYSHLSLEHAYKRYAEGRGNDVLLWWVTRVPRPNPLAKCNSPECTQCDPGPPKLRFAGNRRPEKVICLSENPRDDRTDKDKIFARTLLGNTDLRQSSYYGAFTSDNRLLAIVGWGWWADGVRYKGINTRVTPSQFQCRFCWNENMCWGPECPSADRMLAMPTKRCAIRAARIPSAPTHYVHESCVCLVAPFADDKVFAGSGSDAATAADNALTTLPSSHQNVHNHQHTQLGDLAAVATTTTAPASGDATSVISLLAQLSLNTTVAPDSPQAQSTQGPRARTRRGPARVIRAIRTDDRLPTTLCASVHRCHGPAAAIPARDPQRPRRAAARARWRQRVEEEPLPDFLVRKRRSILSLGSGNGSFEEAICRMRGQNWNPTTGNIRVSECYSTRIPGWHVVDGEELVFDVFQTSHVPRLAQERDAQRGELAELRQLCTRLQQERNALDAQVAETRQLCERAQQERDASRFSAELAQWAANDVQRRLDAAHQAFENAAQSNLRRGTALKFAQAIVRYSGILRHRVDHSRIMEDLAIEPFATEFERSGLAPDHKGSLIPELFNFYELGELQSMKGLTSLASWLEGDNDTLSTCKLSTTFVYDFLVTNKSSILSLGSGNGTFEMAICTMRGQSWDPTSGNIRVSEWYNRYSPGWHVVDAEKLDDNVFRTVGLDQNSSILFNCPWSGRHSGTTLRTLLQTFMKSASCILSPGQFIFLGITESSQYFHDYGLVELAKLRCNLRLRCIDTGFHDLAWRHGYKHQSNFNYDIDARLRGSLVMLCFEKFYS